MSWTNDLIRMIEASVTASSLSLSVAADAVTVMEWRMENIRKTDKLFWRKIDSASEWMKKRHRENWI